MAFTKFFPALFFVFSTLCSASENSDPDHDFFHRELFGYGRSEKDERNPLRPITDPEIKLLTGEGYEHLGREDGVLFLDYAWKRIGIVRAIGYQKQEQWIPTLIEKVQEIHWPKSSVEPKEVSFPCVWALAQIGEPSIEPVLEAIESSRELGKRQLLMLALEGIRGKVGASQLLKARNIEIKQPVEAFMEKSKNRGDKEESNSDQVALDNDKSTPESNRSDKKYMLYFMAAISILIVLGYGIFLAIRNQR